MEEVNIYKYVRHDLRIRRDNQTQKLRRRISLEWASYGSLKNAFKSNLPTSLKIQVYDQCVRPVMTYGAEKLTLTKNTLDKLRVTQWKMERAMIGISLRDLVKNTEMRQRTKIEHIIHRITTLKWRWARYARMSNYR